MVLGPRGESVTPAPLNPLKMCRWVHACDSSGSCAPLLVQGVRDMERIKGIAFGAEMVAFDQLPHDPNVRDTIRIQIPGGHPPSWHWPAECPWNR